MVGSFWHWWILSTLKSLKQRAVKLFKLHFLMNGFMKLVYVTSWIWIFLASWMILKSDTACRTRHVIGDVYKYSQKIFLRLHEQTMSSCMRCYMHEITRCHRWSNARNLLPSIYFSTHSWSQHDLKQESKKVKGVVWDACFVKMQLMPANLNV